MSAIRKAALSSVIIAAVAGSVVAFPLAASASTPGAATTSDTSTTTISGKPYPGDPNKEAAIVATEEQRIYSAQAIAAAARWSGKSTNEAYSALVGRKMTLFLVARAQPYVLTDLITEIPDAFVRQPDGSFLLSNDIIIQSGATLNLSDPDGLVIHLASTATGFNSIVSTGGSLVIAGSKKAPVEINAWDPITGEVDKDTTDGRAYVRVIGGSASLSYVKFDHLGFWSGITGGISLTGTGATPSDTAATAVPSTDAGTQSPSSIAEIAAAVGSATAGYSYVTALLSHVTSTDNAYGLFVNGSDGIKVTDSAFSNNLVDGIVLHRFVTNSTVSNSTTNNNAVDGFAMTRAATGILVSQLSSNENGRDGISLNGSPLANGPSATGAAVGSYGNNILSDSSASKNARYGISVLGGTNVKVTDNTATSNLMGIAVSRAATSVTVRGNTVEKSTKHGIALLGGTTKATVTENSISGADDGIYLRDSSATIERNKVSDVTMHGVTIIGASAKSVVSDNTLGGSGSTAVDHSRATGVVTVGKNDATDWTSTKPLDVTLRSIFQPLTVLWIVLGLVVLVTAIGGVGRRRTGIQHPYASHTPLAALSRGIVVPPASAQAPTIAGPASNHGTS